MHISIVNFLQMLTDSANIAPANKYIVSYGIYISLFIFDLGPFFMTVNSLSAGKSMT